MLADFASAAATGTGVSTSDLAAEALQRLADAAEAASGAFSRLAGRVASAAPAAQSASDLLSAATDTQSGVDLIEDVVDSNETAASHSAVVWEDFGERMARMFSDLFQQVTRDGEINFASLFNTIAPLITALFERIAGIDISGIVGGIGGLIGGLSGGQSAGFGGILNAASSLFSLFSGGGGLGGLGNLLGAGSSLFGAATGGSGALAGTALGGVASAAASAVPYVGMAVLVAQSLAPILFARSPSVGPTTVARVSPSTREAVYSTDNDGDPTALIDTVETIFDSIERVQSRFGGTLNGNGFDIGYFPNPEDGSGQTGGYNFKAIIGAHAEDEDRFKGLTEPELIAEAVKFIVKEGLDGIDVPEVAEAARHSVAESLEDLFDDLLFAERFGKMRSALDEAGEGVDAYTVALQRQRLEIEEAGRTMVTDGIAAVRTFIERVTTLFPGEPYRPGDEPAVDVSGIGTSIQGTNSTLLLTEDEGSSNFQPGVTGVYDEREGGLVGLEVAGQTLTFGDRDLRDEGVLRHVDPLPEGTVLRSPEGVSIDNDALAALVANVNDLGDAAVEALEHTQEYLDNRERVRDGFAIALADVDALIETIAGSFEPEAIGPFEERLIAGIAAIAQLETELERINEDIATATEVFPELGVAAINVADEVTRATSLLQAQLRADYTQSVERDLRAVTGLGARDEIDELAEEYGNRRADGEAIGITDFADLEEVYRQRLVALLEGSDELADIIGQVGASLHELGSAGDLLPDVLDVLRGDYEEDLARDVNQIKGLGIVDDIADRITEYEDRRATGVALGVEDLSGLDAVLRDQVGGLLDPNALTPEVIEALRIAFADNTLVMEALNDALGVTLEVANDNALAHFSAARATRLATQELSAQVQEQERLATTAERVVDNIADTRRRIALDANLSTLSPQEQLDEARGFFETLAERAGDGDQDAQLDLGAAAQNYLQLARDFYASNEDYARIFADVDAVLGDTQSLAEQQLDVSRAQLEELRAISRGLTGDLAGLPNPDANFGHAPTRNRLIARLTGYAGDFGNGGFSAFRGGLSDALNQAVDLLVRTVPFASGGIMTAGGPLSLTSYSNGGIADGPQLALFGEGRMPEAYVPLPDGRSIPVTITPAANEEAPPAFDGEGLADLIDETRRVTAAVSALRADNAVLRRGLERVVAAAAGAGRAA